MLISTYMEILVACYLNLRAQLFSYSGETFAVIFSYLMLIVTIFLLPWLYIWVIFRPLDRLKGPNFERKWGSFYSESKLTSHWNLLFNLFSIYRRF